MGHEFASRASRRQSGAGMIVPIDPQGLAAALWKRGARERRSRHGVGPEVPRAAYESFEFTILAGSYN